MKTKICIDCGKELPETEEFFSFRKDSNKFRNNCKICVAKQRKDYRDKNHIKITKAKKQYSDNNKAKIAKYKKEYADNNKEKIVKQRKKHYEENREAIAKKAKIFREKPENKAKIKKYQKDYHDIPENKKKINIKRRNKRKTDINFQISDNLRSRIREVLKGTSKSKKSMELLGCSVEELKIYLKNQFTKGMSWDNYGLYGWHIDHIKPCSKFDLTKESEQLLCFNYTNLQPLWAEDNFKKGSKY